MWSPISKMWWIIAIIVVVLLHRNGYLGKARGGGSRGGGRKTPAHKNPNPTCAGPNMPCSIATKCCGGFACGLDGRCPASSAPVAKKRGCFSGEATVVVEDGTTRRMTDVRKGDRLWTFDVDGNRVIREVAIVSHLEPDAMGEFVSMQTEEGCLDVTPDHYVYIKRGERVWLVKAKYVCQGDALLGLNGISDIHTVSCTTKRGFVNVYMRDSPCLYVNGFVASPLCDTTDLCPNLLPTAVASPMVDIVRAINTFV